MSRTTDRTNGDVVRDFLSVADLLEEPRLAQLYAYLARDGEATVAELMDELDLPQGTAYAYVDRLANAGVVEATSAEQPRRYVAREIDLTVTTSTDDRAYTITPALVDAVGRRAIDDDVDTYVDRHGIDGLATALTYAVDRERGDVTHRQMARDLDISALAAEIVLQALRPVVQEHFDVQTAGASVADVGVQSDRDPADSRSLDDDRDASDDRNGSRGRDAAEDA